MLQGFVFFFFLAALQRRRRRRRRGGGGGGGVEGGGVRLPHKNQGVLCTFCGVRLFPIKTA